MAYVVSRGRAHESAVSNFITVLVINTTAAAAAAAAGMTTVKKGTVHSSY